MKIQIHLGMYQTNQDSFFSSKMHKGKKRMYTWEEAVSINAKLDFVLLMARQAPIME